MRMHASHVFIGTKDLIFRDFALNDNDCVFNFPLSNIHCQLLLQRHTAFSSFDARQIKQFAE